MHSKIKQIIEIIIKEYPSISLSEIEDIIGDDIEKNLEKYRTKVELLQQPNTKVSNGKRRFRKDIYRHKLNMESSKKEVIRQFESYREESIENGLIDNAESLTQVISNIEDTSVRYKSALLNGDTCIARILDQEEAISNKEKGIIKKLKGLVDDER